MKLEFQAWEANAELRAHPLYEIPGVNVFSLVFDTLHTVCKGIGTEIAGNCLDLIVRNVAGRNKVIRLATLWVELLECYKDEAVPHSARLSQLTYDMFQTGKNEFPCLTGCKAAHLKYLLRPLRTLLNRHSDGSDEMAHAIVIVERLIRFYQIINGNPSYFLTSCESAELLKVSHELLLHYSFNARAACDRGIFRWNIKPKHHYFYHLAIMAKYVRPRVGWTYADEDFVGRIAKIAKSCVNGNGPYRFARYMMLKYIRVLHIRFSRRRLFQ